MENGKRNYWDLLFHAGSPTLRKDYSRFLSNQKSLVMQTLIHIYYGMFYGIFFFHSAITETFHHADGSNMTQLILSIILLISAFITILCTLLFFFINFTENSLSYYLRDYLELIQSVFVIIVTLLVSINLLRRTVSGACTDNRDYFPRNLDCNPYDEVNSLPMDSVIALMLIPLTFASFMRESRLEWTLISWLISLTALIAATLYIYSVQPIFLICIYAFASLFIIIDFYRQSTMMFFINRKLQTTLNENQLLTQEQKATEMRHMIANVAHDLKTPLSSFMTGIDLIAQELKDCEDKLVNGSMEMGALHLVVETINSCLNNIRGTNNFMLMTINRCLDYTKASKGLKLVPKHETIDLRDALKLPLDCMRNIQQKMSIHLNPLDEKMCSHVITDKQWLQENLLCLLSNAVKYSSHGSVTITVSVHETSEFKKAKGYIATPKELVGIPIRSTKKPEPRGSINSITARVYPTPQSAMDSHKSSSSSSGRSANNPNNPNNQSRSRSHSISSTERRASTDRELFSFHYKDPELRAQLYQQHREKMETRFGPGSSTNTNTNTNTNASNHGTTGSMGNGSALQHAISIAAQKVTAAATAVTSSSPQTTMRKERYLVTESGETTFRGFGSFLKPPVVLQVHQNSTAPTVPAESFVTITNKDEEVTTRLNQTGLQHNASSSSWKQAVEAGSNLAPSITGEVVEGVPTTAGATATTTSAAEEKEVYSHCLLFEIEDTGIGLSEEAMSSLFNPFKQTQRLAGGTGLGLYSLAKRIDALNGQYGVKKRKDGKQGSLFWFTIPYRADQVTADNVINNRNHPLRDSVIFSRPLSYDIGDESHHGGNGSSLKNDYQNIQRAFSISTEDGTLHVLMAEDSHTIAKMTSMMLKRQGYKVTIAENGELAVKLIMDSYHADEGKVKYDVVLMDLQMPVMDGLEATRRLRQVEMESQQQYYMNSPPGTVGSTGPISPKNAHSITSTVTAKKLFPHILVIGVSANSDHETMEEAYQAGIDAFIAKPFAVETFSNTAAALIARL